MLKDKKILIGITGSIAAYKIIYLVRALKKAGAEVKIVMTPAAKDFVSPLVLSTLAGNKVLCDLADESTWANHVMLGRWADVMLMAPLSCNTLAKMAAGICDNLLLAVYFSATCPVVIAPAMDEDMWHHPATRLNLEKVISFGNKLITVRKGELASGLNGEGRMAEPEEIITFLISHIFRGNALAGKKAFVTAGPTYEAIDPVRFIGNHSSGKMGFALAKSLYLQGAEVTLITGPTHQEMDIKEIDVVRVTTAEEMFKESLVAYENADIAILSAAVADYTPANKSESKIKKQETLDIHLVKTKDILKTLGEKKQNQWLVGFALETDNEMEYARQKLKDKNADMIVLNSLKNKDAGFGIDTNNVIIFDKIGSMHESGTRTKSDIADYIVNLIVEKTL